MCRRNLNMDIANCRDSTVTAVTEARMKNQQTLIMDQQEFFTIILRMRPVRLGNGSETDELHGPK